jgi:C-terminal processing protease CtpA/Prc
MTGSSNSGSQPTGSSPGPASRPTRKQGLHSSVGAGAGLGTWRTDEDSWWARDDPASTADRTVQDSSKKEKKQAMRKDDDIANAFATLFGEKQATEAYETYADELVEATHGEAELRAAAEDKSAMVKEPLDEEVLSNASEVEITLQRDPSEEFGVEIGFEDGQYFVEGVVEGTPADRCGAIEIDDRMVEINGIQLHSDFGIDDLAELLDPDALVMTIVVRKKKSTSVADVVEVTLLREPTEEFGMEIGYDDGVFFVEAIMEGTPADGCEQLGIDDRIIGINGHEIDDLGVEGLAELIDPDALLMSLTLRKEQKEQTARAEPERELSEDTYELEVLMQRDPTEEFGMEIGFDDGNFFVDAILDHSPADRCEHLDVDDRIVALNGVQLESHFGLEDLAELLPPDALSMTIVLCKKKPAGEVEVLLQRDPSEEFGMDVDFDNGELSVTSILAGSAADRCTDLDVFDQIVSINDVQLDSEVNVDELASILSPDALSLFLVVRKRGTESTVHARSPDGSALTARSLGGTDPGSPDLGLPNKQAELEETHSDPAVGLQLTAAEKRDRMRQLSRVFLTLPR